MSTVKDRGRKAIEKKATVLERLTVEYVSTDSIRPNAYNPNRQSEHDFELLCASIREDGFTQPIIVQKASREIVDGEHRWRAAKTVGFTEIPVVFVDMDPAQMMISTIRHNRARGSHDVELEAQVLRDLRQLGALDWAQDSLMLDDTELQRLIDDIPAPEALAAVDHSEAWVPSGGAGPSAADLVASSVKAADAMRFQEAKISAAKTEEERAAVTRDSQVFRMAFTYAGDEAAVVKKALGSRPAQRLLELCQKEVGG